MDYKIRLPAGLNLFLRPIMAFLWICGKCRKNKGSKLINSFNIYYFLKLRYHFGSSCLMFQGILFLKCISLTIVLLKRYKNWFKKWKLSECVLCLYLWKKQPKIVSWFDLWNIARYSKLIDEQNSGTFSLKDTNVDDHRYRNIHVFFLLFHVIKLNNKHFQISCIMQLKIYSIPYHHTII